MKSSGLRVSVLGEVAYLRHPGLMKAMGDIDRKIELITVRPTGTEESLVRRSEVRSELLIDLITVLRNSRADNRANPIDPCAQILHRRESVFQNAGDGAPPAGMSGTNHASFDVGQQHRSAVRRDDAEQQTRTIGGHRVRFDRLAFVVPYDARPSRMHLLHAHQFAAWQDLRRIEPCAGRKRVRKRIEKR